MSSQSIRRVRTSINRSESPNARVSLGRSSRNKQRSSLRSSTRGRDSVLHNFDDDSHITNERTMLLAQHAIQPVYGYEVNRMNPGQVEHNLLTNSTFIESEEIPSNYDIDDEFGTRTDQDSTNSLTNLLGEDSESSRSKITCKKMLCTRQPKGKPVFLVFLVYFLETFAFFSTLDAVKELNISNDSEFKRDSLVNFMYVFLYASAGRVLYPIAGLIADAYIGRYRMIQIGLWLFWILFAILTLTLASDSKLEGYHSISQNASIAVFVIIAVLFSAASGSMEANLIPFGADQLSQGAPSTELSSYFYWYYFIRNAGTLAKFLVSIVVYNVLHQIETQDISNSSYNLQNQTDVINYSSYGRRISRLILPMFAILCITVALIINHCVRHLYYQDANRENPLKSVLNVVYFAATVKRQPPRFRRAFRVGERKKPRIELAKIDFDGIFTSEEVENVKTFCRILLIIYSLGGCLIAYGATYAMLQYQLKSLASNITKISHHAFFDANLFELINSVSILIALPILNHVILVCLPNTNIRIRLGLGVLFVFLSAAIAGFLEWSFSVDDLQRLLWLVLPTIVLSVGEMLVFATGLEFIYAQSPNSMKGMLSGLLYLALGIFSGIGSVVFYKYPITPYTLAWFYFIFVIIGSVGFVMYSVVACLYRNRERPVNDESEGEAIRRIVAQRVFSY